MAQALSASIDGLNFQARLFWSYALRLLDDESPIVRVGFEAGPKSFDDIWVEYADGRAPCDQNGRPLRREHFQCKWHVTPDTFGYPDLISPHFVNAKAASLLERARAAQLIHAPDGVGSRFKLVTNWRLAPKDPTRRMFMARSNAMNVDRLFENPSKRCAAGQVRQLWREHLDIDEGELRTFARTLAIGEATDSLDKLRDDLDLPFKAVGLERVSAHKAGFFYDDLIYKWMGQQPIEFDRETFRARCAAEGILASPKPSRRVYGVKTFQHAFDQLEARCADVLDMVPLFDERFIRSEAEWKSLVYPRLKSFLGQAAKDGTHLRLAMDAHASVAFAAGSVLDMKSGRHVELEQRTPAMVVWSPDDAQPAPDWPILKFEQIRIEGRGRGLAIALGVTHDVTPKALEYLQFSELADTLLVASPTGGPGVRSVRGGRHASDLAEAFATRVSSLRTDYPGVSHLFMAAPNAVAFFLGQRLRQIGPMQLYEFDFEGERDGSYRPSLLLPLNGATATVG